MNDRARDVLTQAALNGVEQIKGRYADGRGGFCAVGILLEDDRKRHGWEWANWEGVPARIKADFGIVATVDFNAIVHANDTLGWDFLTIARKVGVE